jgi:aspartate racemase
MRTTLLPLCALTLIICSCTARETNPPPGNEVIMGIFGGMGPEATSDLYRIILEITPATKDQEHIPTIIFSNPQVPDRMTSIADGGDLIKPYLSFSLKKLEAAGASFIAIPCNTVHHFYDYMQGEVNIPVINMISETAAEVAERYPQTKRVGLLATTGTIETGLYHRELEARGMEVITPDDEIVVNLVMKAVKGIKAKDDPAISEALLAEAARNLLEKGAEVIVLGCTEIPLAYNPDSVPLPSVNATLVLARRTTELFYQLTANKSK